MNCPQQHQVQQKSSLLIWRLWESVGLPFDRRLPSRQWRTSQRLSSGRKETTTKRHETQRLKIGEKVLLKNMKNSHRMEGKLDERWIGPYEIEEIVKKGVYRLRNAKGELLARTVTGARLKRYREMPSESEHLDSTGNNVEAEPSEGNADADPSIVGHVQDAQEATPPEHTRKAVPAIAENEEIRIERVETSEEICFQPISTEWRSSRVKALGLHGQVDINPLPKSLPKSISVIEPPKCAVNIRGDGNCYNRTISHLLTGSQEHHLQMRKAISEYIRENDLLFRSGQ